jgi:hypothetical protein
MTPDQLATLARAMGYEVEIDATGGYGVTRVLLCEKATTTYEVGSGEPVRDYIRKTVFRPHEDAAQAWEVLCWLLGRIRTHIDHRSVVCWYSNDILLCEYDHNNTPDTIRRAIVEAAVRVAEAA